MGGFSKCTKHGLILIILLANWAAYLFFHAKEQSTEPYYLIIKGIPSYLIIVFGCYTLLSIGKSLWDLEDYPEELTNLQKDVKRAKENLRKLSPNILD